MYFPILAAILHGLAYAIYLGQVSGGTSVPNPASWTIWAFLAILNAVTFWKASKSALSAAQFFTGSVASLIVWAFALKTGRFAPLDAMGWVVLTLCLLACLIWWATRNAGYANLVVAAILLISSVPTVLGVLHNPSMERALPWYIWTVACSFTLARVVRGRKEGWRPLLLVTPITLIVIHGLVALIVSWPR